MNSSFRRSFVGARATRFSDPTKVYEGDYDLLVCASSWDRRCRAIADVDLIRANAGLLFLFSKRDVQGLREEHDDLLAQYFESRCEAFQYITADSGDLDRNWSSLRGTIDTVVEKQKRPLRVFVDLSAIPRYLSLGLLGYCFERGLAESVTYGYAEGRYSPNQGSPTSDLFTEGTWDAAAIPSLEGEWEPHKNRLYIVSVGFEGTKTLRFVNKSEPDRVALLFPDPAVDAESGKRTRENNERLIAHFQIPDEKIARAHAADPVAGWQQLESIGLENFEKENCLYLCCGTKPHSLAITLRAISSGTGAVMYVVPESHRPTEVSPNGKYWKYEVTDHSALPVNNAREVSVET